jgi:hypothetical protein
MQNDVADDVKGMLMGNDLIGADVDTLHVKRMT